MRGQPSGSPIDDIAFLVRSEHRVPTLVELTVRPRTKSELCDQAGVSLSTIRRTLSEFENRDWIREEGDTYESTQLGAFVASATVDLIHRVETEQRLRDVWQWLPSDESGFTLDMCGDATVTVAEADDPYRPVNRFISLIRETDRCRIVGCDVALIDPCKEEFATQVIDGMQTEIIDAPSVVTHLRSTIPELFSQALNSENLTVWLHDDLPPNGIGLLDDRTVIGGTDPESGAVRVLIDTDESEAREWAASVFEIYRRQTPTIPLETG